MYCRTLDEDGWDGAPERPVVAAGVGAGAPESVAQVPVYSVR